MAIGISPFTPTGLDLNEDRDRNPKQPPLDRPGVVENPEPDDATERQQEVSDPIEEAVPPAPVGTH